jgi:hypothetical protein
MPEFLACDESLPSLTPRDSAPGPAPPTAWMVNVVERQAELSRSLVQDASGEREVTDLLPVVEPNTESLTAQERMKKAVRLQVSKTVL